MMAFESHVSAEFWELYERLPNSIQTTADKQFALFRQNPLHPSLHLKRVGGFWSARVTDAYRALAYRSGNVFNWFWIGPHDEYERLVGG